MKIMHNYPQNAIFLDHNLKLHKMIDMHLNYDNMHTNGIFNALIYINNHVNSCINCMLYTSTTFRGWHYFWIKRAIIGEKLQHGHIHSKLRLQYHM